MKSKFIPLFYTLMIVSSAFGGDIGGVKHVLFFSKAASWEQKIVHRDGDHLSYLEEEVQKLGQSNQIEFTFTKDGTMFTPENLARFDALFFFTSGDMTFEERNGRGDNYPLMTLEGKKAFLEAVRNGKGFVGCNTANYTFIDPVSPGEKKDATNNWRYTRMIGSGYMGHNQIQKGHFSYLDHKFPGMENVPDDYAPVDQWYAFNRLMPDLHVVMALASSRLMGNLYERPDYPIAWARMEGRGRVFYTTMGHTPQIWKDPVFLKMLLGGIRWATRAVDADITPDIAKITPHASDIPQGASKYIASEPPLENPHFPGFKMHFPEIKVRSNLQAPSVTKHVLVFSKSAGYEHPIAYRDGASACFIERQMLEFGRENNIDFDLTKDGSIFSPEKIIKYDAFVFYTSGDMTNQPRNGLGDNYPVMKSAEEAVLFQAIREGKGFVGLHCSIDTFIQSASASEPSDYGKMLGAACLGHGCLQSGHFVDADTAFPGMEPFPAGFAPIEEWYVLQQFQPDLHVILALDCPKMTGDAYRRPNYPVAWARMEGKGRVYYTSLGHDEETWKNPAFRQMLLGALQWTTGTADAAIAPNIGKVTPKANEVPELAQKITGSE
jgi:hypothetical protein